VTAPQRSRRRCAITAREAVRDLPSRRSPLSLRAGVDLAVL